MKVQNTPFAISSRLSARHAERGNATIYVLIVVVLFAALSFMLMRQNDTSETRLLGPERADILAGQIMSYPYQVKQAIDMMLMTGSQAENLSFLRPGQPGFETAPHSNKIYHPGGGGLVVQTLPKDAIRQTTSSLPPGWYLGMFNNVEWTESTALDMILLAHQIAPEVCERINLRLHGSTAIPTVAGEIRSVLISAALHGPFIQASQFSATDCAECEEMPTMCVTDGTSHSFYTIILNR